MIKKLLSSLLLFIIIFLTSAGSTQANEDFLVDGSVLYSINEEGITHTIHSISIENNTSEQYVKSYTFSLSGTNPENLVASSGGKALKLESEKIGDANSINVHFNEAVVGLGNSTIFKLEYDVDAYATKTGEVWEISIPKLDDKDSYRNYSVDLEVPISFGAEAFITPSPVTKTARDGKLYYRFDKDSLVDSSISIGFGDFQVFSYTLKYHLENPLGRSTITQIPIPPDTSFQKVYLESVNPKPKSIQVDEDGNWMAEYELKGRERVDVTVTGSVQLFSEPWRKFTHDNSYILENLYESKYWQTTNPKIVNLAKNLNSSKDIYNYVSENLTYDFERVKPNVQRLGALMTLENPESAICMEYTDLFIALARASGIPAREINGFAYSENDKLQPLSLVADVLHAWPEYWDVNQNNWIPIDPTWGSTTGGLDFFDKLDLRHFTFVIHGKDPEKPYPPGSYKLGPNPQKDVFVNFGRLPNSRTAVLSMDTKYKTNWPLPGAKLIVNIENDGPVAVYDESIVSEFDGVITDSGNVSVILPYSNYEYELSVDSGVFGLNTPKSGNVSFSGVREDIKTKHQELIIYNLILIFLILGFLALILFIKIKNIELFNFSNYGDKFNKLRKK